MENWFVVVMGVSTVFIVLTLIIGLCYLLAMVCRTKETPVAAEAPAEPEITDRATLVAAISATVAEYSGTDASALRIVSIKKV